MLLNKNESNTDKNVHEVNEILSSLMQLLHNDPNIIKSN